MWRTKDGDQHLVWDGPKVLYRTKRECKDHIDYRYGYIATRKDLRGAPHHWRMPRPVKVRIEVIYE